MPILQNIAFLLSAAAIFDLTTHKLRNRPHWVWQVMSGLILGVIGIGVMLTPWTLESGLVFDTRTVLISITGLFFGKITLAITMMLTIAFRVAQGGVGCATGIYTILASGAIGLAWHYWRKDRLTCISSLELYSMGIIVHAVMLLLMLTLPGEAARRALASITAPVLLIYPFGNAVFGIFLRDRFDRMQNISAVAESRETINQILNTVPQAIFWKNADGRYLGCNQVFAQAAGFAKPEEILGKTDLDFSLPEGFAEKYMAEDRQIIKSGVAKLRHVETLPGPGGEEITVVTSKVPLVHANGEIFGVLGVFDDISKLKQAEAEKTRLKEQLCKATKMESIGRLAGGVAHDYNNMLSIILGFTEMSMRLLNPSTQVYKHLQEVCRAAERSSDLTRQLLAFARKQSVNPALLDINKTVGGMLKVIGRLLGEDIKIVWEPAENLGNIKIDPSQLDQVLTNLCINPHEAVEGFSQITIGTGAVHIDHAFCQNNPEAYPGDFVSLSVAHNGRGMDEDTMNKLFEPFFTTKQFGAGTGLGLAPVYGIVKQNHGFIKVSSSPDSGTCFKIFLPDYGKAVTEDAAGHETQKQTTGHETILLVEDEEAILTITAMMLEAAGYRVITTSSPVEAIKTARSGQYKIHLLLADVVMPAMNGKELAEELKEFLPELKYIFMSGYTSDIIPPQNSAEEGLNFLAKPFNSEELTRKVREVLDQKANSTAD